MTYLGVTNAAELGISCKIYVKYCTLGWIRWSCHLIRTMTWCYRGAPILRIRAQELIGLKLVLISSHTCSCRLVCASLLSNIPTMITSIACHTGPDFNFNGSLSAFWELFNALRRINFQNVWNLIGEFVGLLIEPRDSICGYICSIIIVKTMKTSCSFDKIVKRKKEIKKGFVYEIRWYLSGNLLTFQIFVEII